jgi:hypothetical protein
MFGLNKLFGGKKAPPPAAPTMQPVAAKPVRPLPLAVGIVWRADGTPKLEKEFIEAVNENPVLRVHVNNMLLGRGFKLTDQAPYFTGA